MCATVQTAHNFGWVKGGIKRRSYPLMEVVSFFVDGHPLDTMHLERRGIDMFRGLARAN